MAEQTTVGGVVVDGKVILEGEGLPEGTRVAVKVLVEEVPAPFDVTPAEK